MLKKKKDYKKSTMLFGRIRKEQYKRGDALNN